MQPHMLLLAVPLLAAAAPPVPLSHTFGTWLVVCDNVRTCEIRGAGFDGQSELRITRSAGRAKPLLMFLWPGDQAPGQIQADGRALPVPEPPWLPNYHGTTLSTYDRAATAAVIDALRPAHLLTLGVSASVPNRPPAPEPAALPLAGLEDALRLVDTVQSRAGTPDPLAPGPTPVGTHEPPPSPPLPAAPVWHRPTPLATPEATLLIARARHDPAVQHARATVDCTIDTGDTAQALDAGHALVLEPCSDAAYQSANLAIVLPRAGGPARLVDTTMPFIGPNPVGKLGVLTEGGFDRLTGRLSSFHKGRGFADCGSDVSWIWDGTAFRLDKLAFKEACGGVTPGDFPILYRTTTTPTRY